MVAKHEIERFCSRIGEEFGAQRVVLFGSYAEGEVQEDSDVDLLVIGPFHGRSADHSVAMRMKLRPGFAVDILVRSPEKIRERVEMGDVFIKDILEKGKVLYEADNS